MPTTNDLLTQARAGLILATCLSLIVVIIILIATWLISGDLQYITVIVSCVLFLILIGIIEITRNGYVFIASWLLVTLLTLIITGNVVAFGVATVSNTAYVLPIIISILNFGFLAGFSLAIFCSTLVWLLALGEIFERYKPILPPKKSHLTFNAPVLTGLYFMTAIVTGVWNYYMTLAFA